MMVELASIHDRLEAGWGKGRNKGLLVGFCLVLLADGWVGGRLGKDQVWSLSHRQRWADYTLRTADVGDNRSAVLQRTRGNAGECTGKGVEH